MSHIPTISVVLASISATASSVVLMSYASMSQRPKLSDPSSMIVYLTLSDLSLSLVGCFLSRTGPGFPNSLCDSKSVALIYFTFSSTLWTAAMAHSSSVMVQNLLRGRRVVNLSIRYQTFCWGLPLCVALLVHYLFQFGHVGGVDNRICWFDLSGTWAAVCCFLIVILPLIVIQGYNVSILQYFGNQISNFPASADLLSRLSRTLFTVIMSKLLLVLALVFSTVYSLNGAVTNLEERMVGHSTSSWCVTLFIFIMPSIQGIIDCMVFFESRIVSRFKNTRNSGSSNNKEEDNRGGNSRANSRGSREMGRQDPYRDNVANGSSKSTSNPMFRERQSDFVFENFSVPVGVRYNRNGSDVGSDDIEGILGSRGNSVDLSDEGAFNDIDLDSLDGNHSDDDNHTPLGGSVVSSSTMGMFESSNMVTDIDDHGVEFRSLGVSGKFTPKDRGRVGAKDGSIEHSTISVMLGDTRGENTPVTPMKKASEPIDLISF